VAQGDPHVSLLLLRRLRTLAGAEAPPEQVPARTVGELQALAEAWREAERRRLAWEAERERVTALEALARRETQTWDEVESLIQHARGNAYKDGVALLLQLRDLAVYHGEESAFEARLAEIYDQHGHRPALVRRLGEAGLPPP
jgi:hypothetical protein